MRRLVTALLALLLAGLVAPPADAGVTTDVPGFTSATTGVAVTADGNAWVLEGAGATVVRVSPTGQVIGPRISLGDNGFDVAAGPNGSVWVTVPGEQKVVRISSSLAVTSIQLPGCEPYAVADGQNGRMYVACPKTGEIRVIDAATTLPALGLGGVGAVYDLAAAGGTLFAPDNAGDAVRRIGTGVVPTVEATHPADDPYAVTTLAGQVWVTTSTGIGRVATTAMNGTAVAGLATSAPLTAPRGIAASPFGSLYVSSADGAVRLADVTTAGTVTPIAVPAGAEPAAIATTPTGALVSDTARSAVIRLVDREPALGTPSVTVTSPTTATVTLPVDSGGNATTWRVGDVTSTVPASAGGPVTVTASLTGLTPGAVNRLALQASNVRGPVLVAGFSVTTPPATAVTYKAKVGKAGTRLKKLAVTGLAGGESVKVTCKGGGCPVKKKTYGGVPAGTFAIKLLRKATLKPGAKVVVAVTGGPSPTKLTLKVRAGKPPKAS